MSARCVLSFKRKRTGQGIECARRLLVRGGGQPQAPGAKDAAPTGLSLQMARVRECAPPAKPVIPSATHARVPP